MKHFLVRVSQRLLALFFLSVSLSVAGSETEMAAARKAAAELIPKLQAGAWQSCDEAFRTIHQLASSKEPADTELSDKLTGLSAAAIEQGLKKLPEPPEQEQLLRHAEYLVHSLIRKPAAVNIQRAKSVVTAWENALPDNLNVRILRLALHREDKNRAEQIKLSSALMDEPGLSAPNRDWAREVHVSALVRGKTSAERHPRMTFSGRKQRWHRCWKNNRRTSRLFS